MHSNSAKVVHADIEECAKICQVDFLENVHLCISRSEMPKISRPDAKKRFKKYASRCRSLNLRLAHERKKILFGYVSFPYQVR